MLHQLKAALEHPLSRGLDIDSPQMTYIRRDIIQQKPFLKRIYTDWYQRIAAALPPNAQTVLELGSGAGFLDAFIPQAILTEVFWLPNLNATLDATQLPFADNSLDAIVMTDVFHHIPDVSAFLQEASRCVRVGGSVVMIEPWNTPFSRWIYTHLHHEPFEPQRADWALEQHGPLSGANGALPWIVFERDRQQFAQAFPSWQVLTVTPFMPFRYLVSGGVSLRGLVPDATYSLFEQLEAQLSGWMSHLAMFAFIHLQRRA